MTLTLHGYKANLSLLVMFHIIPFIEIYKLHDNDDVFVKCIHFSNSIQDDDRLMEPLFIFFCIRTRVTSFAPMRFYSNTTDAQIISTRNY